MARIAFIGAGSTVFTRNLVGDVLSLPELRESTFMLMDIDAERLRASHVRYELLRHFGFFVTESSEHLAEYVPWFIKSCRPDLIERFDIPLDEYIRRSRRQIAEWDEMHQRIERGEALPIERSHEYGADGIVPEPVGALRRHLAAPMQTNVNVQGLTVEAALTGRREPAYHAAMLDPHTAAELPLDEIAALVDALFEAHGGWIP